MSVTDIQSEIIIHVEGKSLSADSDDLGVFVDRGSSGVTVRNYIAINRNLLDKGRWRDTNLVCVSSKHRLGKKYSIICENKFGDRHSVIFVPGSGIIRAHLGSVASADFVVVRGTKGLFENCNL